MLDLPALDQAVIRPAHLMVVLNLSDRTLSAHIRKGNIPRPDAKGHGGLKLWRLATIRQWNPSIADAIDDLLKHPAFAPRPQRTSATPLLAEVGLIQRRNP